jgi:5,10-methylene-tetrahydrofolate dehydrogenase/methenyl tetrahydrofolate cyclohydrolase
MSAIFDCRQIAGSHLQWVREQKESLPRRPCLATVLYTPARNPASLQYRDLMLKDAAGLGIEAKSLEAGSEEELLALIERLNDDRKVNGVVILYPLHSGLADDDVMDLLSARKDVEGLHSLNLGYLIKFKQFLDERHSVKCVVPSTAKAVVKTLLAYPEIRVEGSFVVIVNNSMRVGKPLGLMLENLGATVVKCYDKTRPEILEDLVRRADILITAVPDPRFVLDPSWVKKGAAVMDVSYQGNIDTKALRGIASYVTASDNRIGAVTRAMMFVNLIYCARNVKARPPVLPVV